MNDRRLKCLICGYVCFHTNVMHNHLRHSHTEYDAKLKVLQEEADKETYRMFPHKVRKL
jgi:hypothetical protein